MLGVSLHQVDLLLAAAREREVFQGFFVDGEDAAGAAELRRHVGDGGAIRQRQALQAVAEEFDELVDDALLAQHFGDGQHEVRGGGAGGQRAFQAETDDMRDEHGDRLAEHGGFRLDAAHAPAQHAKTVHHGGVRVGADQCVGVGVAVAVREDDASEMLHVHLVNDAGVRRYDLEVVEGGLAPTQERVTFAVTLVLDVHVVRERVRGAVGVHLHRVVDDQFGRGERVHAGSVTAELHDGVAHGGEVHDARHAREVLHDDAGRREGDFVGRRRLGVPVQQGLDIRAGDVHAVLEAEEVLEQDLQGERQAGQLGGRQALQAVDLVVLRADLQGGARVRSFRHETSAARGSPPGPTPASQAPEL